MPVLWRSEAAEESTETHVDGPQSPASTQSPGPSMYYTFSGELWQYDGEAPWALSRCQQNSPRTSEPSTAHRPRPSERSMYWSQLAPRTGRHRCSPRARTAVTCSRSRSLSERQSY
jgi:hypothetical protein